MCNIGLGPIHVKQFLPTNHPSYDKLIKNIKWKNLKFSTKPPNQYELVKFKLKIY